MDVGCKIKMDEKFLFVSGKDRLILAINFSKRCRSCSYKDGRDRQKSPGRSNRNESRSPHGSPKSTHLRRTESQRSHSSPRSTSRFPSRSLNQERPAEEHVRQDPHKMSRSSPRGSILFEEIEKEFKEEVIELSRLQAQEEDEENYKHHECIRQLREDYMKKLAAMRA